MSFLAGLLAASGPGPFLDVACGTGSYVLAVAQSGRRAVGIDLSPEMIAQARMGLRRRRVDNLDLDVLFTVSDMRSLPALPDREYAAAACLGNSLPHILTEQELTMTLTGVASRLRTGAPFVIQTVNYASLDLAQTGDTHDLATIRRSQPELLFERRYSLRADGLLDFAIRLVLAEPLDGTPAPEYHSQSVLRRWSRGELEAYLGRAGFDSILVYGAFDLRPSTPDAPAVVLTARKT